MQRIDQVVLVSALVVVLVAVGAMAASSVSHTVEVVSTGSEEVRVDVNGQVELLNLDDLQDGAERTFEAGDHMVTVRRNGDVLTVLVDGEELDGGHHAIASLMLTDDEDGSEVARRVHRYVMTTDGDAETVWIGEDGEAVIDVDVDTTVLLDETSDGAFVMRVGDELETIDLDLTDLVHGSSTVVYRCPEDGTRVQIAEEHATQDHYTCPVCGRVMEKAASSSVRVLRRHQERSDE